MADRFALKWADFQKNVETVFGEVKLSQDFSDVTLVGEDFEVEAHRLVLSAGSLLFHQVLKKAKHPRPLIYLNGTKKVEIEAVLSFLYHGEVTICQENLEQFLRTAKELKIRGILEDETENLFDAENLLEELPKRKDATKAGALETGEIQPLKPGKNPLIVHIFVIVFVLLLFVFFVFLTKFKCRQEESDPLSLLFLKRN